MRNLSIIIPSRNEEFLQRTIDEALGKSELDTEVLVGLDGWYTYLKPNKRMSVYCTNEPVGQRAMMNRLVEMSEAKYVMKLDAHCSLSQGYDKNLIKDGGEDVTIMPCLMNLRPYEWVCKNKHRIYQNKKPNACVQCKETEFEKDIIWQIQPKPVCNTFYLDRNLVFQYHPEQSPDVINETMALQGSGFLMSRKKYWELGVCDEEYGSWGQQGAEVALKTWLSGGRVLCTKNAYMGHWFRQSDEFPYERDMKQVDRANERCKEIFLNDAWPKATRKLAWLVNKFKPLPSWHV